jgi:hypothetical protein
MGQLAGAYLTRAYQALFSTLTCFLVYISSISWCLQNAGRRSGSMAFTARPTEH